MIEKINSEEDLSLWLNRDIYSVRILSLLKSYGCKYNFATFYRQIIDGEITAIFSKLDNDITISLGENYDNEEIVDFLCITGYSSVLTSADFFLNPRYEEGFVMKCNTKHELAPMNVCVDEYPKLMELFNFVDYDKQDFKAWYVDISHRIRHKTAKAYTLNVDEQIVSSGILSSIIDDYSILTAVRTENEFRKMGYASFLVKSICNDTNGTVYIMRDENKNEKFYNNCGFENIGKWRIYR